MRNKKSSLIWIVLSVIVLLSGMCSQIERTDSFLAFQQHATEADVIESIKNDLYIGNCTNKLITGLRDTFQKSRRFQRGVSIRNYADYLWIREKLQVLCSVCITVVITCQLIKSSKTTILNYIHDQDGEK